MKLRESLAYDQIPGLSEAIAQERFDRSVAFLGFPETVCGVECRPLTLLDVLRLDCAGSPFVCGGNVGPLDVGAFFKLQCTHRSRLGVWWMLNRLGRRTNTKDATAAIVAFIEESFSDAPPSSGEAGPAYWTAAHQYLHVFGEAYGWPMADVLHQPLKMLLPQLNVIRAAHNQSAPLFNPRSDKVRGMWLASQHRN